MKALIIEADDIKSDLLSIKLAQEFDLECVPRDDSVDAISMLEILPDVKYIITRDRVSKENTAVEIAKYLQQEGISHIQMIVIGDNFNAIKPYIQIVEDNGIQQCIDEVVKVVQGLEKKSSNTVTIDTDDEDDIEISVVIPSTKKEAKYMPVPIHMFKNFNKAPCEIFIQILKDKRPNYLKVLHTGIDIDPEFFNNYRKKNVLNLFIKTESRENFSNKMTELLFEKLKESSKSMTDSIEVTKDVHNILMSDLSDLGMSEVAVKLANETVTSVLSVLQKSESFVDSLSQLFATSGSYNYRHCYMTSIISYNILKQYTWADKEKFETLVFASFFHDVSLTDELLLKIDSEEDLKAAKVTPHQKNLVLNHAKQSVAILENKKDTPTEALRVIRQHHGSNSGVGLNSFISQEISPLTTIFIIAQTFTKKILDNESKKIDAGQVISEIEKELSGPNIKKTIEALKKALQQSV